jgi:hypothetical protein
MAMRPFSGILTSVRDSTIAPQRAHGRRNKGSDARGFFRRLGYKKSALEFLIFDLAEADFPCHLFFASIELSGFPKHSVDAISKFQMTRRLLRRTSGGEFYGVSGPLEFFGGNVKTKGADLKVGPRLFAF